MSKLQTYLNVTNMLKAFRKINEYGLTGTLCNKTNLQDNYNLVQMK